MVLSHSRVSYSRRSGLVRKKEEKDNHSRPISFIFFEESQEVGGDTPHQPLTGAASNEAQGRVMKLRIVGVPHEA